METMILLIVAMAALCCMAANTAMIFKLLHHSETASREPEKTPEEKERERLALERDRLEMEGLQNMMNYTGFGWKNGGKSE